MSRKLSAAMDAASDAMAERIEPLMRDAFFRVEGLSITYDEGQWQTILATLTEKMPKRLASMPISKDDRMEVLTMLDVIDRTVREKGSTETAETLVKALVTMFDLFGTFRHAMKLTIKQDGIDITEEIFGSE